MTSYISSNEYGESMSKEDDLERLRKELGEIIRKKNITVLTEPKPQKERIYIVAGNYAEFEEYRDKKLDEWRRRTPAIKALSAQQPEYICVHDFTTLLGLQSIKGFFIGTYKNRQDYPEILHKINCIKAIENLISMKMKEAETTTNGVEITYDQMQDLYEK